MPWASSEAVWVPHENVCPPSPNVLCGGVEISVLCAERDICMFSSVVVVQSSSGGSCPGESKGSGLVLFIWFCDPSLDLVYDCKGKKNIRTGQKFFHICQNGCGPATGRGVRPGAGRRGGGRVGRGSRAAVPRPSSAKCGRVRWLQRLPYPGRHSCCGALSLPVAGVGGNEESDDGDEEVDVALDAFDGKHGDGLKDHQEAECREEAAV